MANVDYSKWQDIQGRVGSELSLLEQITLAKGMKVAVPPEVLEQAETELKAKEAADALDAHATLRFGTSNQPDKVYVTTKPFTLAVGDDGKITARGQSLMFETRCLDELAAVVERARERCQARGIPTSPTADRANPGSDAPRQPGDKGADGKLIK